MVPGALVIIDEELGGRAEVLTPLGVKCTLSFKSAAVSFVHLTRSRALHHPVLGWRLESPGILWLSIKRLAFLDVLEHGQ